MKRLIFGLLVAGVAFGASAFKSTHKSQYTSNFLVQRSYGIYSLSEQGEGICALSSIYSCKFLITNLGKYYIPKQSTYSVTNINNYLNNGWIMLPYPHGNVKKIFFDFN